MKLKMSDVIKLNKLYDKIKTLSLSISTTYKFSKLFASIQEEANFYGAQWNQLIQEYGQKDENGQYILSDNNEQVQIATENVPIVKQKLGELLNLEVDVPDTSFNLDELESVNLSVEEFSYLLPFILS